VTSRRRTKYPRILMMKDIMGYGGVMDDEGTMMMRMMRMID
jgi:hypothetical protein